MRPTDPLPPMVRCAGRVGNRKLSTGTFSCEQRLAVLADAPDYVIKAARATNALLRKPSTTMRLCIP